MNAVITTYLDREEDEEILELPNMEGLELASKFLQKTLFLGDCC